MRDPKRLEELSSAAALGLWADDIVLALDRATSNAEFAKADTKLLTDAADMLEAAAEEAKLNATAEVSKSPVPQEAFERFPGRWIALRDGEIVTDAATDNELRQDERVEPTDALFRVPAEASTHFLSRMPRLTTHCPPAGPFLWALARTERPLTTPKSPRELVATSTTLNLVAALARQQPGTDEQASLRAMASILYEAATGSLASDDYERVRPAMELFEMIGEHQLVASNSVLASR